MDNLDYSEMAAEEIEAFTSWKEKYEVMNPPPTFNAMGWEFMFMVVVTSAQVILAAMRTANMFFKAAALEGNETLAYIQAIMAILAIEGGLVALAMRHAKDTRSRVSWLSYVAMAFMIMVSMIAGLGQSINLFPDIDPLWTAMIGYGLVLLLGLGASLIAAIGGHLLGQILVEAEYKQENYHKKLLQTWSKAPERRLARADLTALTKTTKAAQANYGKGTKARESIEKYLNTNGLSPHDVRPIDVANELQLKPNTVRVALKRIKDSINGNY